MDISTGIIVLALIYCILFFFDTFFKTCAHYPYVRFLDGTGLNVKFLQIHWTTKALNRTLIRWGSSRPKLLNFWFDLGVFCGLILIPIAIVLLFVALVQNFRGGSSSGDGVVLEPLLPGVNLPFSELGYYGGALLISSLVHEIGHALAAVKEDVSVNYIAVSVIFCLPVAYVNLATEKLFSLQKWKVLRILFAGVWHNLVLSLLAFSLYLSLPVVFSLFFEVGKGVTLTNLTRTSPLFAHKGLKPLDVVLKINDCFVRNERDYYDCLNSIKFHKPAFCVESDLIHNLDESIPLIHLNDNLECCDTKRSNNLCFEYLDTADGVLELPTHACLPARIIVEKSHSFCTFEPHVCPQNLFCFRPLLANNTNLFKIVRRNNQEVIYIGLVSDLTRTMEVSSYIPKRLFTSTLLPDIITKLIKYVIVFSLGLAIINVIPCLFFDGQHIINVLVQIVFLKKLGLEGVNLIATLISWVFSVILVVHCVYFVSKQSFF